MRLINCPAFVIRSDAKDGFAVIVQRTDYAAFTISRDQPTVEIWRTLVVSG